jgi:hypothetical protein
MTSTMLSERNRQAASHTARALLLLALAPALVACGSSNPFRSSPLDVFSTSSKATNDTPPAAASADVPAAPDIDCPGVQVRTGAATLMIGSKPGEGEPAALDVRYQGSIIRTARECHVNAGIMTMKVGIEGRIITGPAGGPGTVDIPLRVAVVREGVTPKMVVSKFGREAVSIGSEVDRATFTHVESDIAFPVPQPVGDIDKYVVYVGFDPQSAQPEKKEEKPPAKKKTSKKRKPAAKPPSS